MPRPRQNIVLPAKYYKQFSSVSNNTGFIENTHQLFSGCYFSFVYNPLSEHWQPLAKNFKIQTANYFIKTSLNWVILFLSRKQEIEDLSY